MEKSFDKIQNFFLFSILNKLRIEGIYFYVMIVMISKLIVYINWMGKNLFIVDIGFIYKGLVLN